MADEFNHEVEADLIFMYSFTILHFIDRCTRWHAAAIIPDPTTETLIATLDKEWVSVHGAMKELIMDQETGISNPMKSAREQNQGKAYFDAKAIKYVPRAKEQHIGHIDRRGALLRDTIHRVVEQCKLEGFEMPFSTDSGRSSICRKLFDNSQR